MKWGESILGIMIGLLSLGAPRAARADARPDYFRISRVDYRGSACPSGTASVDVVGDSTAFIVIFDIFNVQAGPDLPLTEASKFCNLVLYPDYPAGWSFTAASLVYRGNAVLGEGVVGRFRARYSFPGSTSVSHDIIRPGPFFGDFELVDPLDVFAWSPCSAQSPMTITLTGQVDNHARRDQSGLLTTEQADGTFETVIALKWRRCS